MMRILKVLNKRMRSGYPRMSEAGMRGIPLAIIFNPIWTIIILSATALFVVYREGLLSFSYSIILSAPLTIYIIYYLVVSKLRGISAANIQNRAFFGSVTIGVCTLFLAVTVLSNILMISHLINYYGGLNLAISEFGSAAIVTPLQRKSEPIYTYTILLNYMSPVFLSPLIFNIRSAANIIVPLLVFVSTFLSMGLYGARVIFLDLVFVFILVYSLRMRFNFKYVFVGTISIFIGLTFMAYLQSNRAQVDLKQGFNEIGKYYSISTSQGAKIINNNENGQPLYWILRPSFSIPIISGALGAEKVYESIFGQVPIKTREDDFTYVKNLGADPGYNTLSIYGYLFLDTGMFSIIVLLLSYVFLDYIYYLYIRGKVLGILLFPLFYSLATDQMRTAGIFATRTPFFVLAAFIISSLYILEHSSKNPYLSRIRVDLSLSSRVNIRHVLVHKQTEKN